jgi:hypothetical protein
VDLVPVFAFKPDRLSDYGAVWNNINPATGPSWLRHQPVGFQRRVQAALVKDFFIVPKVRFFSDFFFL